MTDVNADGVGASVVRAETTDFNVTIAKPSQATSGSKTGVGLGFAIFVGSQDARATSFSTRTAATGP